MYKLRHKKIHQYIYKRHTILIANKNHPKSKKYFGILCDIASFEQHPSRMRANAKLLKKCLAQLSSFQENKTVLTEKLKRKMYKRAGMFSLMNDEQCQFFLVTIIKKVCCYFVVANKNLTQYRIDFWKRYAKTESLVQNKIQ